MATCSAGHSAIGAGGEVDMFQVVRSCRRAVSAESDERTAATCHTDPTVGTDAARLPRLRRQNVQPLKVLAKSQALERDESVG